MDLTLTGLLEQIYRRNRQGLFTLALSITGRPESAEDAVHEAIVRLCRSGKRPSGDPAAYVFAAVRNAAIDQKRKRTLVSIFHLAEPVDGSASAVEENERNQLIAQAIQGLPADQQEAVVLHLYSGLTFAQVAEVSAVPLQTIASRYRRALSKLAEQLAGLK